jgi:uncharacterized membrane protein YfcA
VRPPDQRRAVTVPPLVLAALFAAAVLAGFVDAIAGGGGLITVPALLFAGLPPQLAFGTNKLQSSCGTALATWTYFRAGLLQGPGLGKGVVATLVGAVLGAWVLGRVRPDLLRSVIPILLGSVAVFTWLKPDLGRESRPALLGPGTFALFFGLLLGFYDGFFGPGTGAFWMIACVLVRGLDLREATGHTKAMNLTSNLASLAVFLAAGQVAWTAGLVMAAGQLVGARAGSLLVVRRGSGVVRPVFLTVVGVLTVKLAWDAWQAR